MPTVAIDLVPIKDVVDQVLQFTEAYSGMKLHPYQIQFARRVIQSIIENDGEELTALFSRQSGKTETIADVCGGLAAILPFMARLPAYKHDKRLQRLKDGIWIGIFAPILDQAQTTFDRIRGRLASDNATAVFRIPQISIRLEVNNGNCILLSNGSSILCMSASEQSHIESKTFHLILIEECQEVSNSKLRKSIHPMGASCITGDSFVPLEDGRVVRLDSAKELLTGLKTGAFTAELGFETRRPLDWIDSGVQPCLEVTLSSGKKITGTYKHPIITKPRAYPRLPKWTKLRDVEVGVQVAVPSSIPFFGTNSIGKDEARLLGLLVGDGSYGLGMGPCLSNDDPEALEFFESWSVANGGHTNISAQHTTKSGRQFKTIFCHGNGKGLNPMINLLREHGIYGQTKGAKRIPQSIFTAPKEEVAEFLGGLFDSDGCIMVTDRRATIDVAQSHPEILEQVSHLLIKFGIHCTIRQTDNSGGFSPEGSVAYRLEIKAKTSIELFARNVRFLTARKQERLERAVAVLSKRRSKRRASVIVGSGDNRHAQELDNDLVWERVVSVKFVGKKQVYDLVMGGAHNFIANNIVVHNTNATLVKIGTPWTRRNDFYDAISRNKKKLNDQGIRNHFEYDYTVAQKYNPLYAKYVEKEMYRLGFDSDEFRMSYRLHWILERGMFLSPEQLDRLGVDYDKTTYDIIEMRKNTHQVAGLDIAKTSDSSVLTVMEVDYDNVHPEGFFYKRVLNWLEIFGDDHESQFHQFKDFLGNYNVEKMCVDSTGVGDPVADRLIAAFPEMQVIPYRFTRPAKSDLYKYLLNDLNGGRIRFPNSDTTQKIRRQRKFVQQMLDLEKRYEGEYLVCEHPDEKDAHDDYPDSLALANWAAKEEGIPTMEMSAGGLR